MIFGGRTVFLALSARNEGGSAEREKERERESERESERERASE